MFPSRENVQDGLRAERKTVPDLSKYERAMVLKSRVLSLDNGAKARVAVAGSSTPDYHYRVAQAELAQGKLDEYIVERDMPDGTKEKWHIRELAQQG